MKQAFVDLLTPDIVDIVKEGTAVGIENLVIIFMPNEDGTFFAGSLSTSDDPELVSRMLEAILERVKSGKWLEEMSEVEV